jgi:hypothetical protein
MPDNVDVCLKIQGKLEWMEQREREKLTRVVNPE